MPSPLISTILAANAIERFGSDAQKSRWLPSLADVSRVGTFAILEGSDSLSASGITTTARREGDVLVLNGEKLFVPDAGVADLVVVVVRIAGGREDGSAGPGGNDGPNRLDDVIALVVLDRDTPGLSISPITGMDLTKPMGALS